MHTDIARKIRSGSYYFKMNVEQVANVIKAFEELGYQKQNDDLVKSTGYYGDKQ